MHVIFCEGKNDRYFIHEAITYKLSVDSRLVKTYSNVALLIKDIQSSKQKPISISEGGGFPRCIKIAIRFTRQFWWENSLRSVGVIADSDIGSLYNKLVTYLEDYLRTPCKKHNVNPQLNRFNSEQKLTISFKQGQVKVIWTLEIPESLEKQVSRVLKLNNPKLTQIKNDSDVINTASRMCGISTEEVIRRSVKLLENESWFNNFCTKLDRNIPVTT